MSNNIDQILDLMSKLTLLEASELSSKMKENFNLPDVAAVAPVAVGGSAANADEVKKSSFDVKFISFSDPASKIKGIKALAEELGLSLAEAKKKSESEFVLKQGCAKEDANSLKTKLEGCGCTVVVE